MCFTLMQLFIALSYVQCMVLMLRGITINNNVDLGIVGVKINLSRQDPIFTQRPLPRGHFLSLSSPDFNFALTGLGIWWGSGGYLSPKVMSTNDTPESNLFSSFILGRVHASIIHISFLFFPTMYNATFVHCKKSLEAGRSGSSL